MQQSPAAQSPKQDRQDALTVPGVATPGGSNAQRTNGPQPGSSLRPALRQSPRVSAGSSPEPPGGAGSVSLESGGLLCFSQSSFDSGCTTPNETESPSGSRSKRVRFGCNRVVAIPGRDPAASSSSSSRRASRNRPPRALEPLTSPASRDAPTGEPEAGGDGIVVVDFGMGEP